MNLADGADSRMTDFKAEKAERIREFNAVLNVARSMLVSGESIGWRWRIFIDELSVRAETDFATARRVVDKLEDSNEIFLFTPNYVKIVGAGPYLKRPDEASLPNFIHAFHPEVPLLGDASNFTPSPVNNERAGETQTLIQHHLNQGSTIMVRKPNGEVEELVFIV